MAEVKHGVKLVVSADTTDAKKKLKDVGKTKVDPVRVKVSTDPVKPKVEQPKPVTVQSKFDGTAIGGFVKSLHGVREIVGRIMSAFGIFAFAAASIMTAVSAVKRLKEAFEETGRALAIMRWDTYINGVNDATERLISNQGRLNEQLQTELRLLQQSKDIRDTKSTARAEEEREILEMKRAVQLAQTTDPRQRQKLEDRFAAEDERRSVAEENAKRKVQRRDLEEEASAYGGKASGAQRRVAEMDQQIKAEEEALKRIKLSKAGKLAEEDRGWWELGGLLTPKSLETSRNKVMQSEAEKDPEYVEREKKLEQLKELRKKTQKEGEEYAATERYLTEKAASIRDRSSTEKTAGEVTRSAKWAEADRQDKREQEEFAKRQRKSDDEAAWDRKFNRREDGATAEQRDKATAEKQVLMLGQREAEARQKLADAEEALAAEMQKDVRDRDERRIATLRTDIEESRSTANTSQARREALQSGMGERAKNAAEARLEKISAFEGVSTNRLTAMGLGSGVSGRDGVASDVRRLVKLMEDEVRATKDNKPEKQTTEATYGA